MKFLSIIIPCYNEEVNLQKGVLFRINDFLTKQTYSWEVVIVDDGSTDKSISRIEIFIATHKGFKLLKNNHQGKAQAVISGVHKAVGDVILFADMDQATPIEEINKLLPFIRKNFDVVIGSRNNIREGAPFLRLIMARGFIFLRCLILGLNNISDTQCGFKLFSKQAAKEIFGRLRLYETSQKKISGPMVTAGFDVEILYLARKLEFKIKEVSVFWHYVETRRVNPVSESINGLMDMIRLKINDWHGLYESNETNVK
mgnify:CR=1 FL=1